MGKQTTPSNRALKGQHKIPSANDQILFYPVFPTRIGRRELKGSGRELKGSDTFFASSIVSHAITPHFYTFTFP
jgi:hypothetical protein